MIRVLIVDDSFVMRKFIRRILESDPEIKVIGEASNGVEAIKLVRELRPDVVTMDIKMPEMDGLAAIEFLMKNDPLPIIVISSLAKEDSYYTIKALELGAVDYITKPGGEISIDIIKLKDEIIRKVKNAARVHRSKLIYKIRKYEEVRRKSKPKVNMSKIIIIGSSTGGPKALMEIFKEIDEINACIVVVQHIQESFSGMLAERLDKISGIEVYEAEDDSILRDNMAYVAKGDYHLIFNGNRIKLIKSPRVNGVRPSVDVTMISAAENFGNKTIGVILTGMGRDGANGVKKIKEKGGYVIAQDEKTSIIFSMPKAAIETGCVDKILPLHEIPKELKKLSSKI